MPLLTIFTAPKPFRDPHIATIQCNAIRSWTRLPDVEVLMVGDEEGMVGAASELGVKHLPNVDCNEWGTPLVSSIFDLARRAGENELLCYVNADIIFLDDLLPAVRALLAQVEKFLLIGRRWDLDVTEALDFQGRWSDGLREKVRERGRLHPPAGSDYFVFPRSIFKAIPPFAIGRAGWDNWMIYHARKQGWAVVDGTRDVMVVHQNHDYAHLGGVPHYDHEESKLNIELARGPERDYTGYMILDSDRELRNGKLLPARPSLIRLVRRLEVAVIPKEKTGPRWALTRRLRRFRKRLSG